MSTTLLRPWLLAWLPGLVPMDSREDLRLPMLSLCERGGVRLPALFAARLVQALGACCDELVGLKENRETGLLQDHALVRRLQKIERLSRRDKQTLLRMIDRFLESFSGQ